jgi:hypothetical protein
MTNQDLKFFVHNQSLAPSYSVPALDAYQAQKNIHVVSKSNAEDNSLTFGNERLGAPVEQKTSPTSESFFARRLETALAAAFDLAARAQSEADQAPESNGNNISAEHSPSSHAPSYFPGSIIPGPGGASCNEVTRGNLLFAQFQYLLAFDGETRDRVAQLADTNRSSAAPSRPFCREESSNEAWLWKYIEEPKLYSLHQAPLPQSDTTLTPAQALAILKKQAAGLLQTAAAKNFDEQSVLNILALVAQAWFSPSSGLSPVTWGEGAVNKSRTALVRYHKTITEQNILPFIFELEAMASHISLGEEREDRKSFARGVFAGNFIEVAMAPVTSIKPTEFCVRERLFDEVINLSSRGFAPVVINEYGLVADGNHRLTAAYVWNILKYCQDLEWCLDNEQFQRRAAAFADAVQNGLLKTNSQVSPISMHQALSHLSYFLCRPDWRARLNSYTRPLLKRHDFMSDLPVVVLPEYLSGAVVKSLYDDGERIERACPSMYEAMSLNNHLVLPPRASYHFTDAALLPWFTVLKTSCGTKHRSRVFGQRGRVIPKT